MSECEDIMRAALERIAGFGHSPIRHAREALAEVDALPENDTETRGENELAERLVVAEARLARIEPLVEAAIRMAHPRCASDHYAAEQQVVFLARGLARGKEPA